MIYILNSEATLLVKTWEQQPYVTTVTLQGLINGKHGGSEKIMSN